MRLYRILTATLLFYGVLSMGQNLSPELSVYSPVSPNSASLGEYGTFPVNHNLGTANVAIPIHTIATGKQQLPLSLTYNTGGVKVNELASWSGLGWTLNAGGAIVRNVKGIPDDLLNTQNILDLENAAFDSTNFFYIYDCWKGLEDSQPDEFVINAPGLSGTFQLDPNNGGLAVFNDRQVAKVEVLGQDQIKVIAPDGTQLIFGKSIVIEGGQYHDAVEESWIPSSDHLSAYQYVSAWYLTEMVSSQGTDTIRFRYKDRTSLDYPVASGDNAIANTAPLILGNYPAAQFIDQKFLERIEFDNGHVIFTSSLNRQDLVDEFQLDKIEVFSGDFGSPNAVKINEADFVYSYFQRQGGFYPGGYSTSITAENSFMHSRMVDSRKKTLRLDEVVMGIGGIGGKYLLHYNATQLPLRGSTSQDQWGYANNNQGSFMPRTEGTYYVSGVPARDYDVGNGDREADPNAMKAAALEKITYPTGGETVFELEANQYERTIDVNTTIPKHKSAQAYGPGCETYGPSYAEVTFTTDSSLVGDGQLSMTFSGATSTNGTATRVEFDGQTYYPTSQTATDSEQQHYTVNLSTNTVYTLKVYDYRIGSNPGVYNCAFTTAVVTWNVPGPSQTQVVTEYLGGLRVKSIKNYDGVQNDPVTQKEFVYENENVLRPFREKAYGKYFLQPNGDTQLRLSTEEYYNNNLINRPVVEYGKVTEYLWDNGSGTDSGKQVYTYNTVSPQRILGSGVSGPAPFKHAQANTTGIFAGLISVMQDDDFSYYRSDDWQYGTLALKETFKRTGTVANPTYLRVKVDSLEYQTLLPSEIKHNYIFANVADPTTHSNAHYQNSFNTPFDPLNDPASYVFNYYVAKKSVGRKVLDKTIEKVYDISGQDPVITTTDHFYENLAHLMPTRTEIGTSDGKTVVTKMFYPDDLGDGTPLGEPYPDLTQRNAIVKLNSGDQHRMTEPIQVETSITDASSTVLSRTVNRTIYKNWDADLGLPSGTDFVLPEKVLTLKGSYDTNDNPMEDRIVYERYDAEGNPLVVSKADGPTTVYVWGYEGQFPVAKVENATYTAVENILDTGFDLGSGGLSVAQANALRSGLANSLVSTYTYDPMVGVTSMTDPSGYTMHYEYDAFNRLEAVRDADNNLVTDYEYHYKNQQ